MSGFFCNERHECVHYRMTAKITINTVKLMASNYVYFNLIAVTAANLVQPMLQMLYTHSVAFKAAVHQGWQTGSFLLNSDVRATNGHLQCQINLAVTQPTTVSKILNENPKARVFH